MTETIDAYAADDVDKCVTIDVGDVTTPRVIDNDAGEEREVLEAGARFLSSRARKAQLFGPGISL